MGGGCSYRKRHWCIFHASALAKKVGKRHARVSRHQWATRFRQHPGSGSIQGGRDLPIRNSRLDTVREIKCVFVGRKPAVPPEHTAGRGLSRRRQDAWPDTPAIFLRLSRLVSVTAPFPVRFTGTGEASDQVSLFGFNLLLTSEITAQLTRQIFAQIFSRARQKFPGNSTCRSCLAEHDISFKNGHCLTTDRYRDTLCHSSTALLRFVLC